MPKLQDIMTSPALNGVYRLDLPPEELPARLVPVLDGRGLADKDELLATLGRALDFPDYYGGNWDALEECLNDLSWRDGPAWLVIRHADAIPGELLAPLLDIFAEAAETWSGEGRSCALFLSGLAHFELPEAG